MNRSFTVDPDPTARRRRSGFPASNRPNTPSATRASALRRQSGRRAGGGSAGGRRGRRPGRARSGAGAMPRPRPGLLVDQPAQPSWPSSSRRSSRSSERAVAWRSAFGVSPVHVGSDVVEEQRGGEGRGGLGLDLDQRDLLRVNAAQQPVQRGRSKTSAGHSAVGLEDYRGSGGSPGRPRAGSGT